MKKYKSKNNCPLPGGESGVGNNRRFTMTVFDKLRLTIILALALTFACAIPTRAQMVNDMTAATTMTSTDLFYLVRGTADRKLTWSTLFDAVDDSVKDFLLTDLDGSLHIKSGSIVLNNLSTALINYINAAGGGTITNNPDDVTLENKTGSTIGLKRNQPNQLNFLGGLKAGSDSSFWVASNSSSTLLTGRPRTQLAATAIDTFGIVKLAFDYNTFNGDYDPMVFLGYNIFQTKSNHPGFYLGIEGWYNNGTNIISEFYLEKYDRDGEVYRPLGVTTYDGWAETAINVDRFEIYTKEGNGGNGAGLSVFKIETSDTPNVAKYVGNWDHTNGIMTFTDFGDTNIVINTEIGIGIAIGNRDPAANLEVNGTILFTGTLDITSGRLNMNTAQSTLSPGLTRYTGNYMVITDFQGSGLGAYRSAGSAYSMIVRAMDGLFVPNYDNEINLGDASLNWKDAFFNGSLQIKNSTVSSGTSDYVKYYSTDLSAGNTIPSFYTEGSGVVTTTNPTSPNRTIAVRVNGTVYYIAAKTTND